MKREIKFRGLRVKSEYYPDKWKYGNLLNECSIGEVGIGLDSYTYAEVIPETVGEFTGIKDKNGVEIYEGDILKTEGIVSWNDVEHRWSVIDLEWNDKREWHNIDYTTVPLEVIGNIHENPELLK